MCEGIFSEPTLSVMSDSSPLSLRSFSVARILLLCPLPVNWTEGGGASVVVTVGVACGCGAALEGGGGGR